MSESMTAEVETIHTLPRDRVFEALETSQAGLSQEQAAARQRELGKNLIQSAKKKSPLLVFLSNFTHLMAILLWVAGAIAFFAGMPELGVAVWLVNVINGVFSFWQEYQAGKATEALKKMLPSYANVIRDGSEQKILAEDLVPGDVMLLAEGDKISADARLIQTSDLQVNQSTLNGESNPVRRCPTPCSRRTSPPSRCPTSSSPAPASRRATAAPWSRRSRWTPSSARSRASRRTWRTPRALSRSSSTSSPSRSPSSPCAWASSSSCSTSSSSRARSRAPSSSPSA
ncbi:MAG: cation-transporting P-type ATPase [Atopobiaceae bacterium]|nr:cation-transporting P-type ATPase [Atopobiaceae bacterium]